MSRRYDSRTTIFSPEGRLYQVEYAMEAIQHAGTALGIVCQDGVVLAAEKRVTSKLLDEETAATEKIYRINDHIVTAVAGITADATILIQHARMDCLKHFSTYQEHMPVEHLVEKMCDLKQGYTQYGGLRPFGVSFLWAGWDDTHLSRQNSTLVLDSAGKEGGSVNGWQLYCSDPSGNYAGWKAHCVGGNAASAQSILKQDYNDELTLFGDGKKIAPRATPSDSDTTQPSVPVGSGMELALKVLAKTMESTTLSFDKLEICILTKRGGQVGGKIYQGKELDVILEHYGYSTKKE